MADEQVADAERRLEMFQLAHDLRPDRHIQGGDSLVQHDQPRIRHQGAGDGDALALAATELMREKLCHVGLQADEFQYFRNALLPCCT